MGERPRFWQMPPLQLADASMQRADQKYFGAAAKTTGGKLLFSECPTVLKAVAEENFSLSTEDGRSLTHTAETGHTL